mmetsp:Transcript_3422/g.10468  ORF Transcript_3422/g.10468 Transcript_3422/m.10468 type:complete len:212 (-) Transcript_3422:850-1485(-)
MDNGEERRKERRGGRRKKGGFSAQQQTTEKRRKKKSRSIEEDTGERRRGRRRGMKTRRRRDLGRRTAIERLRERMQQRRRRKGKEDRLFSSSEEQERVLSVGRLADLPFEAEAGERGVFLADGVGNNVGPVEGDVAFALDDVADELFVGELGEPPQSAASRARVATQGVHLHDAAHRRRQGRGEGPVVERVFLFASRSSSGVFLQYRSVQL